MIFISMDINVLKQQIEQRAQEASDRFELFLDRDRAEITDPHEQDMFDLESEFTATEYNFLSFAPKLVFDKNEVYDDMLRMGFSEFSSLYNGLKPSLENSQDPSIQKRFAYLQPQIENLLMRMEKFLQTRDPLDI